MQRSVWSLAILSSIALLTVTGCGKSEATSDAAKQESPARGVGPQETVAQYLEAVRVGDAASLNQLLTAAAKQKTTELGVAVAPPGSETAKFEVGPMKFVSDEQDAAHVESRWSDVDDAGESHAFDVTWILRQEKGSWRVAGMMGQFVEGQPIMVFNFENPEQVIRQQRYAQQEMIRRAEQRQVQAPPKDTLQR